MLHMKRQAWPEGPLTPFATAPYNFPSLTSRMWNEKSLQLFPNSRVRIQGTHRHFPKPFLHDNFMSAICLLYWLSQSPQNKIIRETTLWKLHGIYYNIHRMEWAAHKEGNNQQLPLPGNFTASSSPPSEQSTQLWKTGRFLANPTYT